MAKILIIDDKENILRVLRMILEKENYKIITADRGTDGLNKALSIHPDIIISDIKIDDLEGPELFHILNARGLNIPFIFITAYGSIKDAVSYIKEGAVDYITKPIDYPYLKRTIARLLKSRENKSMFSSGRYLVGSSAVMKKLYQRIETVASTTATVLISGESGTGKELVARAIHARSSRKNKPFIPVNCSAISTSLLESELFGYEKGSFTGALKQKKGLFETADTGTIFLDEISEIDPSIQVKLLRVLQEQHFTRVGGTEFVSVNVRILAATNRNLSESIKNGSFREDLYYRLNVIPIHIPPLREHMEDIPELASYFTRRICQREQLPIPIIEEGFIKRLQSYQWPGNTRELENLVERILILNSPPVLEAKYLDSESFFNENDFRHNATERDRIIKTLRLCRGNKTETAKVLGIPRRTLYHKIHRYSIEKEDYGVV
ncbi:MAG: sigma-54-dependent Fis family transcriptional regulator [Spirochaetales bacterium]|nr:sigma-54-dependent Fis family transcriptional regulator [Spirochaetales bacterium]